MRHFSASTARPLSPLLNLAGLSNSRESQHFSKEHKLPRTEFSPQLQLIRSSEVDPFAPAPGATPEAIHKGSSPAQEGWTAKEVAAYQLTLKDLFGELQSQKVDATRASEALEQLYRKYRRAEVLGSMLLLSTLALLVLQYNEIDIFNFLHHWMDQTEVLRLQKHYEDRNHWIFAGGIGEPQRATTIYPNERDSIVDTRRTSQVSSSSLFRRASKMDESPPSEPKQQSFLSSLFWSRPVGSHYGE
jgi:hypothetical protein